MKDFFKNISIYGILPIIGKFSGFFLIPIYARVFSSYQFGIIELFVTLTSFLMYACNLEFYTAIGKFFYKKNSLNEKRTLISSGLLLTIFFSLLVIIILIINNNFILLYFFDNIAYDYEFKISLIWLFLDASSTYLGVIPRYNNQQKLFVLISSISLLLRLGSTVFFILVLNSGIVGVLYGHIVGSFFSLIMNIYVTQKYLGIYFKWSEIKNILSFALPIVPGVLLVGLWQPFSRNLISKYYSIEDLGLLSFAIRITSILEVLNYGIRFAWLPMLFENYEKENFKTDIIKISKLVGILSFMAAISLTLLSSEISTYIGTKKYERSAILIGFLAMTSVFEVLRSLRGFGPLILKKTYLLTIAEIGGICSGLIFIFIFSNSLGLIGIGFLFLIPAFLKYIFLTLYTRNKFQINLVDTYEYFSYILVIISIVLVYINASIIFRCLFLIPIIGYSSYYFIRVMNFKGQWAHGFNKL